MSLFSSFRRTDQHLSCKAWLCAHLTFAMSLATSALPIKVIFLFLAPSLCACCNWLPAISFPNQRVQWTLNWIVAHQSPSDQCIWLTCNTVKPLSSPIYWLDTVEDQGSDISHFCTQWSGTVVISGFLNFKPKWEEVKSPCFQQGCRCVQTNCGPGGLRCSWLEDSPKRQLRKVISSSRS